MKNRRTPLSVISAISAIIVLAPFAWLPSSALAEDWPLENGWQNPLNLNSTHLEVITEGRFFDPEYPEPSIPDENKQHFGIDLRSVANAPVYAIDDGTIEDIVGSDPGNAAVIVRHQALASGRTFFAIYGHCAPEGSLQKGSWIPKGARIGTILRFRSWHLHFGINSENPIANGWGRGPIETTLHEAEINLGWQDPLIFLRAFSNNHSGTGPVGIFDGDIVRQEFSGSFLDAYSRFRSELGAPIDDGGGRHVHEWLPGPNQGRWNWYGFKIQNFDGGSWGNSALVFNRDLKRTFVLRGGFWNVFRYGVGDGSGYGPTIEAGGVELGFPESDELPDGIGTIQYFTNGAMRWDGRHQDESVHVYSKTGVYLYTPTDHGPSELLNPAVTFDNGGRLRFFEFPGAESYLIFKNGGLLKRFFPALQSAPSAPESIQEEGQFEVSNAEGQFEVPIGAVSPSAIVGFQVVAVDGSGSSLAYSHMVRARAPGLKPDIKLGRRLAGTEVGNNVYSTRFQPGGPQSLGLDLRRPSGRVAYFRIENDAERLSSYELRTRVSRARAVNIRPLFSAPGSSVARGKGGGYSISNVRPGDSCAFVVRVGRRALRNPRQIGTVALSVESQSFVRSVDNGGFLLSGVKRSRDQRFSNRPLIRHRKHVSRFEYQDRTVKDVWTTDLVSYGPGTGGTGGGGLDDESLRVGGWGDTYASLLLFDLDGLPENPKSVVLWLYSYPVIGSSSVGMALNRALEPWPYQGKLWWADRPAIQLIDPSLVPPPSGGWYHIDLLELYRFWKKNPHQNFGLVLTPMGNNNQFNHFFSSHGWPNTALRPKLVLTN